MASKKRRAMKRKLGQADLHIKEGLYRIKELHGLFEAAKPELALVLAEAAMLIFKSRELLDDFARRSWRTSLDDVESYLGQRPKPKL